MNEVVQREALRRIAEALREMNGTGVLLKGAAVLSLSGDEAARARATGDIDLYVAPPLAARLREKLLAVGFTGSHDAPRTSSHHLAPVVFQGVPVEIHTRIMSSCWRLPEREMLERARPLEALAPLATLDPEGMILHAGAHASAHLFSHGLKTAWDMLWIFEKFPRIDWRRLANWVEASGVPRAFWVPMSLQSEELDIPFP